MMELILYMDKLILKKQIIIRFYEYFLVNLYVLVIHMGIY